MTDLRYAFRQLLKSPGFSAVAILTLALSIGATTAVFSLVREVLLRPPAFPEPQRLVVVRTAHVPELSDFNASPGDYLEWRDGVPSFEALAASAAQSFTLTGSGEPRRLLGARATAELFTVFGLQPALGRAFGPADDRVDAEPVAVLSHAFWRQHFGGDPAALGQRLRLDGRDHTVIGVMPAEFRSAEPFALWVPMAFSADERSDGYRGARFLDVLGRLRAGATIANAQAELDVVAARLARQYPGFNAGWTATVSGWIDYAVRDVRLVLWLLLAAVGCVLAVACSNLASVTLARGLARERELAVRASLGATRGRLLRQLVSESLVLATIGGLAGWLVAAWAVEALLALAPTPLLQAGTTALDPAMLGFVLGLSLVTGLLFGVAPARRLASADIQSALKTQSTGATASGSHTRFRRVLTVVQLGTAAALLTCTALLVRSLVRLTSVDPGFNPAHALALQLDLSPASYLEVHQQEAFARNLLDQVRSQPGVVAAGVTHALPLRANWSIDFLIEGHAPAADGSQKVGFYSVTPDYFAAMGIRLLRGRAFAPTDSADAPPVAIVNEAFARRYFPNGDALGQRIYLMKGPWKLSEIVGIVADVKQTSLAQSAPPQAYEPFAQWPRSSFTLVVRTRGAAALAVPAALRNAVAAVDPQQPITSLAPLETLITTAASTQRFVALLLTTFALVSTLIATVGVFGVMAHHVSRRTREFGICLALGASPARLIRGVLREGVLLIGAGGLLGLALAALALPVLRTLLFEAGGRDATVLLLVFAVLAGVGLLACWIPARRVMRINPIDALRAE